MYYSAQVVIFALPGAFTPTCSKSHLPGFVENQEQLKAKGIDTVVCLSVNDSFVMDAWGKDIGVGDKVLMCADGNAEFTKVRRSVCPGNTSCEQLTNEVHTHMFMIHWLDEYLQEVTQQSGSILLTAALRMAAQ